MKKKICIGVVTVAVLVLLVVVEYKGMKKFMSVPEPAVVEHQLSENSTEGIDSVADVVDETDHRMIEEVTDKTTVVASGATEEVVEDTTETVEEVAEATTEESSERVVVAELDVDIPSFSGKNKASSGFKGDTFKAQSGATTATSDLCYSNGKVELVNSDEKYYKAWIIYTASGEKVFESGLVEPGGSATWDASKVKEYTEYKLETSLYKSEDTKVSTMNSKLKIKVEE